MEISIIQQILDLIAKLGINPLILLAIVFIVTGLKKLDSKNKFKAGYVLFPLIASIIVVTAFAFASKSIDMAILIRDYLTHAALGAYGYNIYSKLIRKPK
ncbi:MAG TPA: hypothetical protein VMW50_13985 [Dehalococcoidia bacterium]|nr:hypothetical protein [Dehalococcoidia bacterium]